MHEIELTLAEFLVLARRIGNRIYKHLTQDGVKVEMQDGAFVLFARISTGTADYATYESTVAGLVNAPMDIRLGRKSTHELAGPHTWFGETLPVGHPDKPGTAFVVVDGAGVVTASGDWIAAGDVRGRFKAIDQVALPYDALNPATYWVPRSSWRMYAPTGKFIEIIEGRVEVNMNAALAAGKYIDFQLYTHLDPGNGYAQCPKATVNSFEYAVPGGRWRYNSINLLRGMANSKDEDNTELASEVGDGVRIGLCFNYVHRTRDDKALEAYMDGRYDQFFELRLKDDVPLINARRAVASFQLLTRPYF